LPQRLADLQPESPRRRSVAPAHTEAEAPAGQLVDDGRRLRILEWMARVDVGDARAERDRAGHQRERLAEREAVARARAIDAREALLLEALGKIERGAAVPGHRHQTDRRLGDDHVGGLEMAPHTPQMLGSAPAKPGRSS